MANLNQFLFDLYSTFEDHPAFEMEVSTNTDLWGWEPEFAMFHAPSIKFKSSKEILGCLDLILGSSLRKTDTIRLYDDDDGFNSVVTFKPSYDEKDCDMIIQIFIENELDKVYKYDIKSLRIIKFEEFPNYHEIEIRK